MLMRDESCTFIDWACYVDGNKVIGANELIQMVVQSNFTTSQEDKEVIECFKSYEEGLDANLIGDDEFVISTITKN